MTFRFEPEKEYSWTGEFWYADTTLEDVANHFGGTLTYSLEKGFQLHIITGAASNHYRETSKRDIHGVIPDLHQITLMNCLLSPGSTYHGEVSYSTVKFKVQYLVKGKWVKSTDTDFIGISFHCPLLDSFSDHAYNWHQVRCEENIVDAALDNGLHISIHHGYSKNRVRLALGSRGEQFKEKCEKLNEIIGDDDMVLSKAYPIIRIMGARNTADHYRQRKYEMTRFFSALTLEAVHADKVWLHIGDNLYEVMSKLPENLKTSEDIVWQFLPITLDRIKVNFKEMYEEFQRLMTDGGVSLLNILLREKLLKHRFQSDSVGYLQYCWIINTIGDWQCKYGSNIDNETGQELTEQEVAQHRFDLFLKQNLQPQINSFRTIIEDGLKGIFGNTSDLNSIGKNIKNIRNCLEHIDNEELYEQYKAYVEDESCINNLCELLFLLLMEVLYKRLGITFDEPQSTLLGQKLVIWSKY